MALCTCVCICMCVCLGSCVRASFAGMQYECLQSEMVANLGIHFEQSLSILSAPVTEQQAELSEQYLQDSSVSIKSWCGNQP